MKQFEKILWPTDFSISAQSALAYIESLATKYQAEIHVLHVVEDIAHHEGWYGDFDRGHVDKIVEWVEKTGRKRLDQICSKYLDECPLYIKHVRVGDPAEEILKLVKEENVDMVVMTTKGEKGLFPFGSVAEKVVKTASVPVVTIPVGSGQPEMQTVVS